MVRPPGQVGCCYHLQVSRGHLATILLLAIAGLVLLAPAGATAQTPQPPQLQGRVTDLTGKVQDVAKIEASLEGVEQDTDSQLFALFVERAPGGVAAYTGQVVAANNLGASDSLLVIALTDRTYQLWVGDRIARDVSQDEQDDILADRVEPALRTGDYAGAVTSAATGLREAASGSGSSGSSGGGGISFPSFGVLFLPLLLIIGIPVLVIWLMRKAARGGPGGSPTGQKRRKGPVDPQALAQEASHLLLATDEAVREAQQELKFAEAELPASEVATHAPGVEAAAAKLHEAFELQAKLDPDGGGDGSVAQAIIDRCTEAQQLLKEALAPLAQARDAERDLPKTLAGLRDWADRLDRQRGDAQRVLTELQEQAKDAWAPVAGNLAEAEMRTTQARTAIGEGDGELHREERGKAVLQARVAEKALSEAEALCEAVANLGAQLMEARTKLPAAIAEAERSLLQAKTGPGPAEGREAALAEVGRQVEQARALSRADPPDLIRAYQAARHADASADELLARAQTALESEKRSRAALAAELGNAESALNRAEDYIRSRRGSVGTDARARLAEARKALSAARGENGTDAALAGARRAEQLAGDAYRLASSDFDQKQSWGSGGPSGGLGLPGAIILGGMMGGFGLPGGRRRGGWGGLGGIGGGRSRGGGFGGGGGRSRGGRW